MSIVIPVYDESTTRLRDQLRSINAQTVNATQCEIVYIVNNGDRATTPKPVLAANNKALAFLKKAKAAFHSLS
ncbi:MAG: glycosyltransferase [Candidatus Nomurabacteria bacterium]|nr:MAG: glycosyltransferase [Candidatus Nomurabacteria bacterium]